MLLERVRTKTNSIMPYVIMGGHINNGQFTKAPFYQKCWKHCPLWLPAHALLCGCHVNNLTGIFKESCHPKVASDGILFCAFALSFLFYLTFNCLVCHDSILLTFSVTFLSDWIHFHIWISSSNSSSEF